MLPWISNEGKPLFPSWVYSVIGLLTVFLAGTRYPDPGIRTMAVGLIFLMMHTGIETAVNRYRIERLEKENQALRRLLEMDGHAVRR